ncbi:MAG: tail fiber protein [Bacteroidia bacterium]|nr:tail fiber protein [Bacteroidia bacterium]
MDQTIAEIRLFAGDFAPKGWAFCDGQLLKIAENTALFSLVGTMYGGDGRTTFALPDLRGRVPVHIGSGHPDGLSLGQQFGAPSVTLTSSQLPAHAHYAGALLRAADNAPDSKDPTNALLAKDQGAYTYHTTGAANTEMHPDSVTASMSSAGGGQPYDNHQASFGLNYIIALIGVYPSRS